VAWWRPRRPQRRSSGGGGGRLSGADFSAVPRFCVASLWRHTCEAGPVAKSTCNRHTTIFAVWFIPMGFIIAEILYSELWRPREQAVTIPPKPRFLGAQSEVAMDTPSDIIRINGRDIATIVHRQRLVTCRVQRPTSNSPVRPFPSSSHRAFAKTGGCLSPLRFGKRYRIASPC
jgi:hypothetical protein